MRIALLLSLALASPAAACPLPPTPVDMALMIAGPFFALIVVATWLGGMIRCALGRGAAARRSMALATLSVGLVQAATIAAIPLAFNMGFRVGEAILASTMLAMFFAGPYWARQAIQASEARGGQLIARAGSLAFPLIAAAGYGLAINGRAPGTVLGTALVFAPLLALLAIPIDRAPDEPCQPPASRRPSLPRGHCPVCREVVRDRVATCARCHTPHHRECLDFNGRCGIFACEPGAPDPTAKKKTAC